MSQLVHSTGLFITNNTFKAAFGLERTTWGALFDRMVRTFGLLIVRQSNGSYSTEGQVTSDLATTLTIKAFEAVILDANGVVRNVKLAVDTDLEVSGGDGTYKILFEAADTYYEAGTITLTNGDATVLGDGTDDFREIFDPNEYVVIDSSGVGNNGKYQIDSITDATHMELKAVFTGTTEAGLQYAVGGYWKDPSYEPGTDAGFRIYKRDTVTLVATTGAVASGQYWLAQVVKSGGTLGAPTDKRTDNVLALFSEDAVIPATRLAVAGEGAAGILSTAAQSISGEKTFVSGVVYIGKQASQAGAIRLWGTDVFYGEIVSNIAFGGNRTLAIPDVNGVIMTVDGGQTVTNATWQGTDIGVAYGGTGASDAAGARANLGAAAASHVHAAGDVTTGTFDVARIPDLDAGKITTGVFNEARIPTSFVQLTTGAYEWSHSSDVKHTFYVTGGTADKRKSYINQRGTATQEGIVIATVNDSGSEQGVLMLDYRSNLWFGGTKADSNDAYGRVVLWFSPTLAIAPTQSPGASRGGLYMESGALKYRAPGGLVTTIAPAS